MREKPFLFAGMAGMAALMALEMAGDGRGGLLDPRHREAERQPATPPDGDNRAARRRMQKASRKRNST